jgi:hypothetical protein
MKKRPEIAKINVDLHQHDLSNFLHCPFKYKMANVDKIIPRGVRKAINIGDLFAKCVYFLHNGEGIATCMAYVNDLQKPLLDKAINQSQVDQLETSVTIVQSMLFGYETRFLNKDNIKVTKYNQQGGIEGFDEIKIEKIIPEYKIEVPFIVGNYHYNYINRLDGNIITSVNPWILELKTTSQIDSDLIQKLNTNFQINSYWFAKITKDQHIVDGVLYRYIRKPSIRLNKGETPQKFRIRLSKDYQDRPEFYFYEESLYFNQNAITNFIKDLRLYFEDLTRCYVTGTWQRRGTACDSNYGLCEYLKYCSNPTEETLRTFYEHC